MGNNNKFLYEICSQMKFILKATRHLKKKAAKENHSPV